MERFLERITQSDYKYQLILKGGMLIASILDVGQRLTKDTDITLQGMKLDIKHVSKMVKEIASISMDDDTTFLVKRIYQIMEDAEYSGVRVEMNAHIGHMQIPMKLDISTGDAVTPSAIKYSYSLLLENRDIEIYAYNIEAELAEKIETMLARSTLNTRMRDFYDMWALSNLVNELNFKLLFKAINATIKTRKHNVKFSDYPQVITALRTSVISQENWMRYQSRNKFASEVSWTCVLNAIQELCTNAYQAGVELGF